MTIPEPDDFDELITQRVIGRPSAVAPPEQGIIERHGLDEPEVIRAVVWGAGLGTLALILGIGLSAQAGQSSVLHALYALFGGVAVFVFVSAAGIAAARISGRAAGSLYAPRGDSTPPDLDCSAEDAMQMRGDVDGALASLESRIAAAPASVPLRVRAAEMYAGPARNPARAAELFRDARAMPGCTSRDDVYTTNRLIDLFAGPLADDDAMMRELDGLAARYAGTKVGDQARAAWEAIRREKRTM